MNWSVLRREWGAVTFVLTVIVGMIVVPLALYFNNQGPAAIAAPPVARTASPIASSAQTASSAATATSSR